MPANSSFSKPHNFTRKQLLCAYAALFFLIGGIYLNVLNAPFIWDDHNYIVQNHLIRNIQNIPVLFQNNIASGSSASYHFYRPLQELTHMFDYQLFKLNMRGHHFTSILIHFFTAIMVLHFVLFLSKNAALSFITSLLFAVHPVHVEAVTYLSGRGDLIATGLLLASCLLYWKNEESSSKARMFSLFALSLLAFLAKEVNFLLPVILLGYHFFFGRKLRFIPILPIVISFFIYIAIQAFVVNEPGVLLLQTKNGFSRVPGFFSALFSYVRILLLPFYLHFDYGQKIFSVFDPKVVIGFWGSVALVMSAIQSRKKYPLIGFSIFWFFLNILPYSNVYLIFAYMADHNLYCPSIGFFILLSAAMLKLSDTKLLKLSVLISVLYFGSLTVLQNQTWRDPILFYERILKYNPNSSDALHNLGSEYGKRGDLNREIEYYKKSLALEPLRANYHKNLGYAYIQAEKWKDAREHFLRAISLKTGEFSAHAGLGIVAAQHGSMEDAIKHYYKSLQLNPYYYAGLSNLATSYFRSGNYKMVLETAQRLISLDPADSDGYYLQGLAYHKRDEDDKALASFEKAVKLSPDQKKAYFHLAVIYRKQGNPKKAEDILKKGFPDPQEYHQAELDLKRLP